MTALTIEQRRAAPRHMLNRPDTDAKRYSHLEMEAALNVWEYLTEAMGMCRTGWVGPAESDEWANALQRFREDHGTVDLRSRVVTIGAWCLRVYEAMTPEEVNGHAYDWEVIPAMCRRVSFDRSAGPLLPDIVATAQAVAEELNPRRAA